MSDGDRDGTAGPHGESRGGGRRMPSGWDIARSAGVSQSTVSRVMNHDPRISEATRERVEAAMARLGYRPNAAARTLITGRSHLLGLVVSNITNPFYPEMIESIVAAAAEHDYTVVLGNTQESEDLQLSLLDLLIEQQVDGAILTSPLRESAAAIARRGLDRVPLVTVNRRMTGQRLDSVHLDNAGAGRLVAEHLVGLGHRRIGFVGGLASASTNADRLAGVRAALRERGCPMRARDVVVGEFTWRHGYDAATTALGASPRPTALICADDLIALGVMDVALDLGLRIPDDVAVVGFDDVPVAALRRIALTTVRQPVAEMGRRAVELLVDRITNGPDADPVEVVLPPSLVVRRTCGAYGRPPGHEAEVPSTSEVGSGGR
jgi:LacI family transcriptional regulator